MAIVKTHTVSAPSRLADDLAHLATFDGRAGLGTFRRLAPAFAALAAASGALYAVGVLPGSVATALASAAGLGLVALTVRRLHDCGCTGRLVGAQLAALAAMVLIGAAIYGHSVSLLVGEGALGMLALVTVALGAAIWRRVRQPGSDEANRYGPPLG